MENPQVIFQIQPLVLTASTSTKNNNEINYYCTGNYQIIFKSKNDEFIFNESNISLHSFQNEQITKDLFDKWMNKLDKWIDYPLT